MTSRYFTIYRLAHQRDKGEEKMPCDTDYLEPNHREAALQHAAKLLVYLRKKTSVKPEAWAVREANNIYAKDERSVTELCAALKTMNPKQRDTIVYNAREKTARELADWWEEHLAADARRKQEKAAAKKRERHRQRALAKLSKNERKALDC